MSDAIKDLDSISFSREEMKQAYTVGKEFLEVLDKDNVSAYPLKIVVAACAIVSLSAASGIHKNHRYVAEALSAAVWDFIAQVEEKQAVKDQEMHQ